MKYTRKKGKRGNQYQDQKPPPACAATILLRFRLCATINTPTKAKPMAIS
jgi:hypothetical protein